MNAQKAEKGLNILYLSLSDVIEVNLTLIFVSVRRYRGQLDIKRCSRNC